MCRQAARELELRVALGVIRDMKTTKQQLLEVPYVAGAGWKMTHDVDAIRTWAKREISNLILDIEDPEFTIDDPDLDAIRSIQPQ